MDEENEEEDTGGTCCFCINTGGSGEYVDVSRFQMLEYLSVREWWTEGAGALMFTIALWAVLGLIVWLRTDVEAAFEVKHALATHFESIIAHPSLSGVEPRPAALTPVQCQCACQAFGRGPLEKMHCGGYDSRGIEVERLRFMGTVPEEHVETLRLRDSGSEEALPMKYEDVESAQEAWYWIQHGALPAIWKPFTGRANSNPPPGMLLGRNLVLGGVRIRQTRAMVDDDCGIDENLRPFYTTLCRSDKMADSQYGPENAAEIFNDVVAEAAFQPNPDKPGVYDALLTSEAPLANASRSALMLERYGWCDGMTQSLELQATLLNAEVGLYGYLTISFVFPEAGGVDSSVNVKTLNVVGGGLEMMDFLPEIIWAVLIVILLLQEIYQIVIMIWQRRLCSEYLSDFWNLMDWFSICVGVPVAFYWWAISLATGKLGEEVVKLPRAPLDGIDMDGYRTAYGTILDSVESILVIKMYHKFCLFFYTTLVTLRFLKNFQTQQKLAVIQFSVTNSFWDILHFMFLYVSLFANFALGGRILFGTEMEEWSSFAQSSSSTMRMLMGYFAFEDMFEVAPVSATVWFWLFLLCMVFMLSNLLLAIIVDHFSTLREMIGVTPPIWHDIKLGIFDLLWRLEWRKDRFMEGEYWMSITSPYDEVGANMMEESKVDERFMRLQRGSCLGVRIARREMENSSLWGLGDDGNPGGRITDQLDLRQNGGAHPSTADHLLEGCSDFVASEVQKQASPLVQVRQFVHLLKRHKDELHEHCLNIEEGMEEDKFHLWQALKRLEQSIRVSLGTLEDLRTVGVESWAPPLPGQVKAQLALDSQEEWREQAYYNSYYQEPYQETQYPETAALRDAADVPAIEDSGMLPPDDADPYSQAALEDLPPADDDDGQPPPQ
eukprot:TRINITY_DN74337_c0_g1_i1.p1 TRINITY_DN74337_c0_g1~~TRINITY_DN74337_c0_g1_i1.p1  ORF type:complete len:892 (+),score=192.08 TRINITY_DN74337_c0_g1_i1:145-2820(+)